MIFVDFGCFFDRFLGGFDRFLGGGHGLIESAHRRIRYCQCIKDCWIPMACQIGGAFGKIVSSLVSDIIMPPIGMIMGSVSFSDLAIALGEGEAAATLNYGIFIDTVINFVIVALAVFMLIKAINTLKKKEEEKPAEPPKPSAEETLLTEIRDLLAKN